MSGGNLIYDTNTLIQVVPNLKTAQTWALDRFFPNSTESDSEYVSIDIDIGKRRMSPFVSPLVESKLVESRRFQTNVFKPPYIKDKRAPDLRKPVRRMIGERIGGDMTGEERMMANLEAELTDQIDMINRRLEWMALQSLINGGITLAGDGYESVYVDFGRDPTLTVALTGANQWGASLDADGRDPLPTEFLEFWQAQILKKSGAVITDIIFTTTPWTLFLNSKFAEGAIYYPKFADGGNMIDPGARIKKGAVYKGKWGQYDLWLYNDWYVDANNVEQPMIPDGTVIMTGEELMGVRAFAQIIDPRFNYAAMAYAPKTWITDDPGQQYIMMQSSPLPIPARVNASFSATVCAPASLPV